MGSLYRKIKPFILYPVVAILIVLVVLLVVLQVPAVQTYIAKRVTTVLAKDMNTELRVDKVRIGLFKTVTLKGLYAEDLQHDTLLYAGSIQADISLFQLLRQKVQINSINLSQVTAHVRQDRDSVFNFQFLIDHFAGNTPKDTSSAPSAWQVQVDKLTLNNIQGSYNDAVLAMDLNLQLPGLQLSMNGMDLNTLAFDVRELLIQDADVQFVQHQTEKDSVPKPPGKPLEFPDLGIKLRAEHLQVTGTRLAYNNENFEPVATGLDPNHLDVEGLDLVVDSVLIEETTIAANLRQLSLKEQSGLTLKQLAAHLAATDNSIDLRGLVLQTPNSEVNNSTQLLFNTFANLEDFMNTVDIETRFGDSHVGWADVALLLPDLKLPDVIKPGAPLNLSLQGSIAGRVGELDISDLVAGVNDDTRLHLSGRLSGLPNLDSLQYDVALYELSSSYAALAPLLAESILPPGLAKLGTLNLQARASGSMDSVTVEGLKLGTDAHTQLQANLTARHITDLSKLKLNLNLDALETNYQDLAAILDPSVADQLKPLGNLKYQAKLKGTLNNLAASGQLTTRAGSVSHELKLSLDTSFNTGSYKGKVNVKRLDVAALAGVDSLGPLSLTVDLQGKGFNLDDMELNLVALVEKLNYKSYDYSGLELRSSLGNRFTETNLSLHKPDLSFLLNVLVDLDTLNPNLKVHLSLDTLNAQHLGLYASPLSASGVLACDLSGLKADKLKGTLDLTKLHLSDSLNQYVLNSLKLETDIDGRSKKLNLNSDLGTASVQGTFDPENLQQAIIDILNDSYPVGDIMSLKAPIAKLPDQQLSARINITGATDMLMLFVPGLQHLGPIDVSAEINTAKKQLDLDANVPDLMYDSIAIDRISLQAKPKDGGYRLTGSVNNVSHHDSTLIYGIELDLSAADSTLHSSVAVLNDSANYRFLLSGVAHHSHDTITASVIPPFYLNNNEWQMRADNQIQVTPHSADLYNLEFTRDDESFSLQTIRQQLLTVGFDGFRLQELTDLIQMSPVDVKGRLNGYATINPFADHLDLLADLGIESLYVDTVSVGSVALQAKTKGTRLNLTASIEGPNSFNLTGFVDPTEETISIDALAPKLNLNLADPFLPDLLRDSKGYFTLKMKAAGNLYDPTISGSVQVHDASTYINFLAGRYALSSHEISITDQDITIPGITLLDPKNRTAVLSGHIKHNKFQDPVLDLNFKTDEFQFFDIAQGDNDMMYGKMMLKLNANIKGSPDLPTVKATAKTLDGTDLVLMPTTQEESLKQEDFVLFLSPEELQAQNVDSVVLAERKYTARVSGVDLSLNLEMTDDAKFEILMDPVSGDMLQFNGSGNLGVQVLPTGDVLVSGSYLLAGGQYVVSYNGKAKKEFTIASGSRIDFAGDPMNAVLDITAIYKTRTSTYGLVANQTSLSDAEKEAAQKKSEILVYLYVKGKLSEPTLSFDIGLPEGQSNLMTSTVARKLEQIRQDETELNKQVFGLLLFNSFITTNDNAGTNLGDSGEKIALSSVSKLITNQLNNLADKVKAVDISVNLDSYQNDYGSDGNQNIVNELGFQVSKGLANDRVTISVNGNVDLESSSSSTTGQNDVALTTIAGDFVLEYKLTEDGRYRVSVFQSSDYDLLTESNTYKTGVGINYQESFGDPVKKLKKTAKKKNE